MDRDERTYGRIRDKYDEYVDIRASKPERPRPTREVEQRSYTPESGSHDMGRTVFAAIGIGIGFLLLVLSGTAFYAASTWADVGRDGASTGYTIVGFFLLLAGVGGMIATWNHNYRVLAQPGGAQHP